MNGTFDGTVQRQCHDLAPLKTVRRPTGTTAVLTASRRSFYATGEALTSRNGFNNLSQANKNQVIAFLNSLVLFGPDDTASKI